MTKVVYNNCYGGFGLSDKALERYNELKGKSLDDPIYDWEISRHDPILVQVVEELGEEANGDFADLQIANIDGPYRIDEYDGSETVETPDSYDWIYP